MCCREGTLFPVQERSALATCDQLLLIEGDRGRGRKPHTLPLVAGARVEADVEDVGLRLAGRDGTEVDAGRQAAVGRERGDAADTHGELVDVETRTGNDRARAGRRLGIDADLDGSGDAAGVGDVERLVLYFARLQVGEVEIEAADGGLVVGQADAQGCRLDIDGTDVTGREVCR